ncbi:MAG: rhamnulokinase [Hungatella sp.]|nr:rhamnulokinase [Hungatella sp.]
MEQYFLAVDIGASSGRHILGKAEGGRMTLEEIYRFPNGMKSVDGQLCWDMEELWGHVIAGMKECARLGKIPVSMGIDTWAVDYVLLDAEDRVVGDTVGYRDGRTRGMEEEVSRLIPPAELYGRTGIQRQSFNTIYQFMAVKMQHPEYLEQAETMVMIPDYFHFRLTGRKCQEYTNATTTQLVDPVTKTWDYDLIRTLGYPERWFGPLSMPGTVVGELSEAVAEEVGFSCQVVLPGTHDTASAVAAVPSNEEDVLYISSGTWSLMGTERPQADCSDLSREHNFTNEGGYDYRFRYLKNIMGLWMIQSVKKELAQAGEDYSFARLCEMAEKEEISSLVDCNDDCFLAPDSMSEAVKGFCERSGQPVPRMPAQLAAVIYRSLADCYRKTKEELEQITGKTYGQIHVVGGGANADFLNQLTADAAGCPVCAGPTEATAIGNLAAQMIRAGVYGGLKEAREGISRSFEIKRYEPSVRS